MTPGHWEVKYHKKPDFNFVHAFPHFVYGMQAFCML